MKAGEIARLAYDAGIHDVTDLTKAIAIAFAESNGNPNAIGDVTRQTATWGPSYGLWQIRSLKAESGKGTVRDGTRLTDPVFNAKSMYSISHGGKDWGPWTTWPLKASVFMPAAGKAAGDFFAGKGADKVEDTAQAAADQLGVVNTAVKGTYNWVSDQNNWMRVAKVGVGVILAVGAVLILAVPRVADKIPAAKLAKDVITK